MATLLARKDNILCPGLFHMAIEEPPGMVYLNVFLLFAALGIGFYASTLYGGKPKKRSNGY
jgi:hypothetical protein